VVIQVLYAVRPPQHRNQGSVKAWVVAAGGTLRAGRRALGILEARALSWSERERTVALRAGERVSDVLAAYVPSEAS